MCVQVLKAATGQAQQDACLQLADALQAITVGSQSFAFHPPTAQERLDLFSQSLRGCTQLGHIHQKAVVKVLQICSSFCPVTDHASADAECTSSVFAESNTAGFG